jgi:hypothetical protein
MELLPWYLDSDARDAPHSGLIRSGVASRDVANRLAATLVQSATCFNRHYSQKQAGREVLEDSPRTQKRLGYSARVEDDVYEAAAATPRGRSRRCCALKSASAERLPRRRLVRLLLSELEESKEFADLVPVLGGMAHGGLGIDAVVIASTDSFAFDVAGFDQVGDDALRGALGDPDDQGDVPEADVRVALDAEQHLGVVREEPPGLVAVRAA